MSDGWVWLRCKGCGAVIRFIAFSGGEWGRWGEIEDFVDEHTAMQCHTKERMFDMKQSRSGYSFFELVTEKEAELYGTVNDIPVKEN